MTLMRPLHDVGMDAGKAGDYPAFDYVSSTRMHI